MQMISEEKIDQMIRSCKNSRDRALIAFMYEGALRPIEVREATWSQITFDQYGAIFNTSKKTGKLRYIRLIRYYGQKYGRNACHRITVKTLFFGSVSATYFTPSGPRKGCRNANMTVNSSDVSIIKISE